MENGRPIDTSAKDSYVDSGQMASKAFSRFLEIIKVLRAPGGCPWDREQTPETLRTPLVEEVFEAVDAINERDPNHIKEELGDVFLNTTMIMLMEEEANNFSISTCLDDLTDKLIRRHPHVFNKDSDERLKKIASLMKTSEEVLAQWDVIKEDVEGRKKNATLDEVPKGFPPLLRAYKLQKKAGKLGFDWPCAAGARDKIFEELDEVESVLKTIPTKDEDSNDTKKSAGHDRLEEEAGDLLFSVVNYIRKLGLDPSLALGRANKKFYDRFSYVEKKMKECGKPMSVDTLDDMEGFWTEAKRLGGRVTGGATYN